MLYRELLDALLDDGSAISLQRLVTTAIRQHLQTAVAVSNLSEDQANDLIFTRYGHLIAGIMQVKAARMIVEELRAIQREKASLAHRHIA